MASPSATDAGLRCTPADRRRELRVLLILSALMSFASVSTDVYLPALPEIGRALHASGAGIELTFSAFLAGFASGQLVWGPLGDRHGRRGPIALGLGLFVVGSIGCAMSTSLTQMMVWRLVQALGASVGPVLSRAMVRDLYGREQAARVLSTLILIMGVAPMVGPLLGGQMLAWWSWQAIFWALAGFGLLTLLSLMALPESLPATHRATASVWRSFASYPGLMRDPRLMGYALSGGFFYAGAYAFIAGTPFVYIEYYHVSPQAYGWLFGLNVAGIMAMNVVNRHLLRRLGSERLFRLGIQIVAASGLAVALDGRFGWGGLAGLAVPIFFYMSMNGFIVANSVAGALAAHPQQAGAASALLGAMHYGSGILSAAMVGWFADGTPWTLGWIMGACGIGSLASSIIAHRLVLREEAAAGCTA